MNFVPDEVAQASIKELLEKGHKRRRKNMIKRCEEFMKAREDELNDNNK